MKCPQCMAAIGPDDRMCPTCGAFLVLERRPARPEDEQGWFLRHLASIMGRAGCAIMIAHGLLVIIASLAMTPQAFAFLGGTSRTVDLGGVAALIIIASSIDLVGLGLIAVALIVLGTGAMFLRRRDPFTEAEVMVPAMTAAFAMAAGLMVFLSVLLTAVWRVIYPAEVGMSAAEILTRFAVGGTGNTPAIVGPMMTLWIVAAIALIAGAACLRLFRARLPAKIISGRPMRPSSWLDFAIFNFAITLGIALFPLGLVGYDTTGGAAQIAFLTLLATKLTFIPLLAAFAYWSLLTRFDAFGKLSLLVPVLKGIPQSYAAATGGPRAQPGFSDFVAPPPSDEDMLGIDRVK